MTLSPGGYLLTAVFVAICLVGGAWVYTSLMPMHFLEGGYPVKLAKQQIIRTCAFGDITVMGDSRPEAAIVPALLSPSASNIAVGAATPVDTYFFARQVMMCKTPPRFVVYAHSLSAFVSTDEFLWLNNARFGFITFDDLRTVAHVATQLHDSAFLNTSTNDGLSGIARDVVYAGGFPTIFIASLIQGRGFARYGYNMQLFKRTVATRGGVSYGKTPGPPGVRSDANMTDFAPSATATYFFDQTMMMFEKAGVRIMVVEIPISESVFLGVKPEVVTAFGHFQAQHIKPYKNIVLASPAVTGWPDDLFVDGSHLTERGATLFSERLASCLKRWQDDGDQPPACDFSWR